MDSKAIHQENITREAKKKHNWICSIQVMILYVQMLNTLHNTCTYLNKLLQRIINSDTITLMVIKEIGNCVGKSKSFNRSNPVIIYKSYEIDFFKWCIVCNCIKTVIDTGNRRCFACNKIMQNPYYTICEMKY